MKKNIINLLLICLMAAMPVLAACNKEAGACRISDLKKISHTETLNDKELPQKRNNIQNKKAGQEKPTFKKFIESLLKSSE